MSNIRLVIDTGGVTISARGEREILMTRVFDAPRHLVFRAMTEAALIRRWFGVQRGWTFEVCEYDARVGGAYRYVWVRENRRMGMHGVLRDFVPNERIVSTEVFDEAWYPGVSIMTTRLVEKAGRTTVAMEMLYESSAARDLVLKSPMHLGVVASFEQLDAVLGSLGH